MATPWLEDLNPAQREAVTFGEGPLLVVAGAGTGKTRTLACRVAHLIHQGVAADRILLLTFTRRASGEMVSRARHMTGSESANHVWGGTFHATANRLLRIYGRAIDLSTDFTVMDQGDAADMMNLIRNDLGLAKQEPKTKRRFPTKYTLVKIYSLAVNAQKQLGEVLETHFPWCVRDIEAIAAIFRQYAERKTRQHLLDYDDLLLHWRTLCAAPTAGKTMADRFDHILVDEYQDTNVIQSEILRGMRTRSKNVMAVGDDAQSIYSFRAATVRNILDFPEHFPGTHVVTLEENYRSTQSILAASNAVMEPAPERYTKNLRCDRTSSQKPILFTCADEAEQSELVCNRIVDHLEQGIPLEHQAVLFRASQHSAELEVELSKRNLPFHKYGGLKFVDAAHIKDMLAFLRILENPFDEISWFRVLLLLEGIGAKTAGRIMDALGVRGQGAGPTGDDGADGMESGSPLARFLTAPPAVPPRAREPFGQLRGALAHCCGMTVRGASGNGKAVKKRGAGEPPLTAQIERVRRFYEPIFERIYENPTIRLRDIEVLEQIAQRYRSRGRFITDLTLDPPSATSDLTQAPHLDEDFLVLSTIHSAKGCEWTVVHIIHAADGMIPSDMALGNESGVEEERRLLYVAMTRAKDYLYVYFPLRYYHSRFRFGDGHDFVQLCRYITEDVRAHFEERATSLDDDAAMDEPTDAGELRDWLKRLWDA